MNTKLLLYGAGIIGAIALATYHWGCESRPRATTYHSERVIVTVRHDTVRIPTLRYKTIQGVRVDTLPCSDFTFGDTTETDTIRGYVNNKTAQVENLYWARSSVIVQVFDTLREVKDSLVFVQPEKKPLLSFRVRGDVNPLAVNPLSTIEGGVSAHLNLGSVSIYAGPRYGVPSGFGIKTGVEVDL